MKGTSTGSEDRLWGSDNAREEQPDLQRREELRKRDEQEVKVEKVCAVRAGERREQTAGKSAAIKASRKALAAEHLQRNCS